MALEHPVMLPGVAAKEEKRRKPELCMKNVHWAEKSNLGTSVKIGACRHHKNSVKTLLNQYFLFMNHNSITRMQ